MHDGHHVAIAMETSCQAGGLLLAIDRQPRGVVNFDAHGRCATRLLTHLAELTRQAGVRPGEIDEVHVSAGPGSFTGLRVGITVARTLAQAVTGVRCVAVPTPQAVAAGALSAEWQHLAVVLDAREGRIYAAVFTRQGDWMLPARPAAGLWQPAEFLAATPRPLLVTGEGLDYHELTGEGICLAPAELRLPTVEGVWAVGSRLAAAGQFTEYHHLRPLYARPPHITGKAAQGRPT